MTLVSITKSKVSVGNNPLVVACQATLIVTQRISNNKQNKKHPGMEENILIFFWYLRNIGVIMNFRNIQKIFCDFLVKILYFEILLYDCCLSKGSRATANEQIKKVWKKQSKSKWKVNYPYLVWSPSIDQFNRLVRRSGHFKHFQSVIILPPQWSSLRFQSSILQTLHIWNDFSQSLI